MCAPSRRTPTESTTVGGMTTHSHAGRNPNPGAGCGRSCGTNTAGTLASVRDLTMGAHTVEVRKLSGNYLVVDGFAAYAGAP